MQEFTITGEHIRLTKRMYVSWWSGEYGAPAIDCKRPYGNSSVASDIAEILGWFVDEEEGLTEDQRAKAYKIHKEMQTVLQIALKTGAFKEGAYIKHDRYRQEWIKKSCPGIDLGDGNFSGCDQSGGDCPTCGK